MPPKIHHPCLSHGNAGWIILLLYGSGQLFWARVIPVSAAIIYSNFAAIFAAMAAGWAWRLPDTPQWRRATLATLFSISSVVAILWPLLSIALRPPPLGGNQWRNRVAMQTSWATCSPAAAATLFRPLCLTDDSLGSGGGFQAWDTRSSFWDEPTTVALSWVTPPLWQGAGMRVE